MSDVLPGESIGILGGGQLGRMLALAASRLGLDVLIFTPEEDSPAARVAKYAFVADYNDQQALAAFAQHARVVTFEFENVPADTAAYLEALGAAVRPGPRALAATQDRLTEKTFFTGLGIAVAPHRAVDSEADLIAALDALGAPAILKTRRFGYDGIGQARIATADAAREAYAKLNGAPAILEGVCAFEREISIVAARGADGAIAFYDISENTHAGGILTRTRAPAAIARDVALTAQNIASRTLDALDYVGVMAIEFFLMPDQTLIVNEMAPRVHNSGHWTMDACLTGQFEQHIRAIAGWPLGPTARLADAEMINLIGDEANSWRKHAADADARLHLYGKREARPGRKMGHVTKLKRL